MGRTGGLLLGLLIGGWIFSATPCPGGNKAIVGVSGHVLPHISQSIVHQEAGFYVTEDDLRRGYVEVPLGTVIEVRTNDRRGYFLVFEGVDERFREIWVMEGERTIALPPSGGLVQQRPRGSGREIKALSYRLFLKEDSRPGFYPWPLTVRASLL